MSIKRLLLMAFIGWLGVACEPAPKPGCVPGSGLLIAEACQLDIEGDAATPAACHARIDAWEKRCLR